MPKKVDANQTEIVSALRQVGAYVQSLASIGKGCPDLLVGYDETWFVLEVKDGNQPPSKQRLTPDELEWAEKANQRGLIVYTVNSVERALRVIGAIE